MGHLRREGGGDKVRTMYFCAKEKWKHSIAAAHTFWLYRNHGAVPIKQCRFVPGQAKSGETTNRPMVCMLHRWPWHWNTKIVACFGVLMKTPMCFGVSVTHPDTKIPIVVCCTETWQWNTKMVGCFGVSMKTPNIIWCFNIVRCFGVSVNALTPKHQTNVLVFWCFHRKDQFNATRSSEPADKVTIWFIL